MENQPAFTVCLHILFFVEIMIIGGELEKGVPIIWSRFPDLTTAQTLDLILNIELKSLCLPLQNALEQNACETRITSGIIPILESICNHQNNVYKHATKEKISSFITTLSGLLYDKSNVNNKFQKNQLFQNAVFDNCILDERSGIAQLNFQVPLDQTLFPNFYIFHAQPFQFYQFPQNYGKLAQFEYVGPHVIAYDDISDCVIALKTISESNGGEALVEVQFPKFPFQDSICQSRLQNPMHKLWKLRCDFYDNEPSSKSNSTATTIQVKKIGNSLFIYCYGFSIRIQQIVELCPNSVISISDSEDYEFLPVTGLSWDKNNTEVVPITQVFNNIIDLTLSHKINVHFLGDGYMEVDKNVPENNGENECYENLTPPKSIVHNNNNNSSSINEALPIAAEVGGGCVALAGVAGVVQTIRKRKKKDKDEKEGTTKKPVGNSEVIEDEEKPLLKSDEETEKETRNPNASYTALLRIFLAGFIEKYYKPKKYRTIEP